VIILVQEAGGRWLSGISSEDELLLLCPNQQWHPSNACDARKSRSSLTAVAMLPTEGSQSRRSGADRQGPVASTCALSWPDHGPNATGSNACCSHCTMLAGI
jgi:hypothetical protein